MNFLKGARVVYKGNTMVVTDILDKGTANENRFDLELNYGEAICNPDMVESVAYKSETLCFYSPQNNDYATIVKALNEQKQLIDKLYNESLFLKNILVELVRNPCDVTVRKINQKIDKCYKNGIYIHQSDNS